MFDSFDGEINGHNIYDNDSYLDEDDSSSYGPSSYGPDSPIEYKKEKEESAPKILKGEVLRETEKAFLFKFNDSENWMPKSQVKLNKKKDSVEIPHWLWIKMSVCSDL
jgi:hypothetical protein